MKHSLLERAIKNYERGNYTKSIHLHKRNQHEHDHEHQYFSEKIKKDSDFNGLKTDANFLSLYRNKLHI